MLEGKMDIIGGIREFPMMLYTKSGDTKIANNRVELQDLMMAGWSKSRTGLSEVELLVLKIEQTEEDLADLKHKLAVMRGEVVEGDGEDECAQTAPINQLAPKPAANLAVAATGAKVSPQHVAMAFSKPAATIVKSNK
jgi:hypothetical protein